MKTIFYNSSKAVKLFMIMSLLFVANAFSQTTYYLQTANVAAASTAGSWKTDATGAGGGTAATVFTGSTDTWVILSTQAAVFPNGSTTTFAGNLQVDGTLKVAASSVNSSTSVTVNGIIIFSATTTSQVTVTSAVGSGSNSFVIGSSATIKTTNQNGVFGTNCSIAAVGSRATLTLPTTANYEFNGSANQATLGLPPTVNQLTLSGSGTKTFSVATTVSNSLSIASGVIANLGTFTHSTGSMKLNNLGVDGAALGAISWGGTNSATYINTTYFSATSGKINVGIDTRSTPTVTPTIGTYTYSGSAQGPNAASNNGTGTSYTYSYVGTTYTASATAPTNAGTYTVTVTVAASTDGFWKSASSTATAFSIAAKPLTIGTPTIASKVYNGTTASGTITAGSLSGLVSPQTLTVSATGTYADANVETGKTATIVYTLANGTNGGIGTNYSLASGSAIGDITVATPTIVVTVGSYTYSGSAQGPNAATNTGTGTSYTYSYVGVSPTVYTASATRPTNAGSYTVTVTVAANGNYAAASSIATSFSITAAASSVTVTGTAPFSYVYDGTSKTPSFTSTGSTSTITYLYSGTGITGSTATAPTNVGTYSVTASVTANGNYAAASSSATAFTIAAKALTIAGLTGSNKVYDGTTTATVTGTAALSGIVLSQTVTLGGTPSYTFTSASVGTAISITTIGYTISGAAAVNYSLTQPSASANITTASLIIKADNAYKVTGTALPSPVTGSVDFSATGLVNQETVGSVTITYGTGAASGALPGTYTGSVTPSAATAGTFTPSNYTISYVSANIIVGNVIRCIASGNWSATSTWSTGVVPTLADGVIIQAPSMVTVDIPNAECASMAVNSDSGTNGANGGMATLKFNSGSVLTIEGTLSASWTNSKAGTVDMGSGGKLIINGTNNPIQNGATPFQFYAGGVFTPGTGTVEFGGSAQTMAPYTCGGCGLSTMTYNNVIFSGSGIKTINTGTTINGNVSITGTAKVNLPAATSVPISTLTLGGRGTLNGTWGSTTATTATYKNNTYFDANSGYFTVATNTAAVPIVTVSVGSYNYNGSPQGPNSGSNTGTGTSYTYSYVGVSGTTYGPSPTQPTNVGSYTVTATVAASTDGFWQSASSNATPFTIKATPTITTAPTASAITYGQTLASSTLSGGAASVAGTFTFTTSSTAPNAGTASQSVTFTPEDATNYISITITVDVTVNTKALTVTGLTGSNKAYDRTTAATATGTAALSGVISPDVVTLTGTPTFTFASANVGTPVSISTTGYTLTGTNAANYTLTQPTLSANITQATLTVTGATTANKEYDGNNTATITAGTLVGIVGSDVVILTQSGTFGQTGVGTSIAITSTSTISGTNSANYSLTQPSLTARNITAKALTVTGATTANKEYDGTNTATITGGTLVGIVGSDVVTLTQSGTFGQTGVGTNIAITSTSTISGADSANYSLTQPSLTARNITAKALTVTAPIIGTITQPICALQTGSVVLSGLPVPGTWTLTRSDDSSQTTGTGTSTTIIGLASGTYTYTVSISGLTSEASANVVINTLTKTWDGTDWSPSGDPTSDNLVIFNGNYSSTNSVLSFCSCQVTSGAVVINSGHTLKVTNGITVSGGSLTFENDACLVQTNETPLINSGNIIYKRKTSTLNNNYDFVYWSSPVKEQKIGKIWMASNWADTFYNFSPAANNWARTYEANTMTPGKGYISRARNGQSGWDYNNNVSTFTVGGTWTAKFYGVPNNGIITVTDCVGGRDCLLGNPYPSALDAVEFLKQNSAVLEGTLYFWTHNNPMTNNAYNSNDYALYNSLGSVETTNDNKKPTGKIAAGQSFFATAKATANVIFNNTMRVGAGGALLDNTQFFRTSSAKAKTANSIEKHRVWLNLSNTQGAFKQTLVGYVTDATNGYDSRFDGESYDGNAYVDFYSINQGKNFTIQGRAVPFDQNDSVPLGFKTTIEGSFTIDIDEVDGLLANQAVYLEDKVTNTVSNLKNGNYTFTTAKGTFNDRFVLRYTDTDTTLSIDDTDKEDGILVFYSNNYKTLIIKNKVMDSTVNSVALFNMAGQNIEKWVVKDSGQTNIQIPIKNIPSGIYIVKVKTTKGESSKKIIVN